jgi:hypothetical protein
VTLNVHDDFERIWWRLFQKRAVNTQFDIYDFTNIFNYSKSSSTLKVIRYAQSHQVRSKSSYTLKVARFAQSQQHWAYLMTELTWWPWAYLMNLSLPDDFERTWWPWANMSTHVRSKSSCSLKVKISDSFGSKKRLNRIIKLDLGHLCPMEENLSFINNYMLRPPVPNGGET